MTSQPKITRPPNRKNPPKAKPNQNTKRIMGIATSNDTAGEEASKALYEASLDPNTHIPHRLTAFGHILKSSIIPFGEGDTKPLVQKCALLSNRTKTSTYVFKIDNINPSFMNLTKRDIMDIINKIEYCYRLAPNHLTKDNSDFCIYMILKNVGTSR